MATLRLGSAVRLLDSKEIFGVKSRRTAVKSQACPLRHVSNTRCELDSTSSASKTGGKHKQRQSSGSNVRPRALSTASGPDVAETPREISAEEAAKATGIPKPKLMSFDYGFQADFLSSGPSVPTSIFKLAIANFGKEYTALRRNVLYEEPGKIPEDATPRQRLSAKFGIGVMRAARAVDKFLTLYDALPEVKPADPPAKEGKDLRIRLQQLRLNDEGVYRREKERPKIPAPWLILGPYYALCLVLDLFFVNRPIQRFWFLETVARIPYFSYISMLHLYETLGWWRVGADVRKVHFAEEWNEMHHLKIMESLGGDRLWFDRFAAQHAAFFYYWVLNVMFMLSPKLAYNFSELVEAHAVVTYMEFVDQNEELLKSLPPSPAALSYYLNEDLYMFDEFQSARTPETRRPKIESLYDVFCAIRDDEVEHEKTMWACQQLDYTVRSPHRVKIKAEQGEPVNGVSAES